MGENPNDFLRAPQKMRQPSIVVSTYVRSPEELKIDLVCSVVFDCFFYLDNSNDQ